METITGTLQCANCTWPFELASATGAFAQTCPVCRTHVEAIVFPAHARTAIGTLPDSVLSTNEASCFYHAANRAAVPCDECGRFLCHLCDLTADGRHLCPGCFGTGVRERRLQGFETQRTMHDSIALALATFPMMMIWPIIISAPLTIFWIIRHWKSPRSIIPRTRARYYWAALFATAEMALIVLAFVAIGKSRR
jgi:hypothetical protein